MLIAERFLSGVVRSYGNHPVSTDGGTWYPQACAFLKIDHHVHSLLAKKREKRYREREPYNTLRIELNALMTTFHVEWKTLN